MRNDLKNSILITGSTRSGTTFMGRMLARCANNLIYLYEPFQIGLKERSKNGVFDYWFENLDENKIETAIKYLERYKRLNIHDFLKFRRRHFDIERIKFDINIIQRKIKYDFGDKNTFRFIIKDPIAIFSTEVLYNHIDNLKVIVMIRSPLKVIESYKKLGWDIGFIELKRQNKLLEQFPRDLVELVNYYTENHDKVNIIDKGILLWNLIYFQVLKYKEKYENNWKFIKLEDVENNLNKVKADLFQYCELTSIKEQIIEQTPWIKNSSGSILNNPVEFTREEKEKIISGTSNIALKFGYFN